MTKNHQTPIDPVTLTTAETIARIERLDAAYSCARDMIYARDLLTFYYEWDEHYNPPTNQDALDDQYEFELSQYTLQPHMIKTAHDMMQLLKTLPRDAISQMRLNESLCPMHGCDYQSCFDDDDETCSQIRSIFPSHDT